VNLPGTVVNTRPDFSVQGGPKKRIPRFIFAITSVIQHRF